MKLVSRELIDVRFTSGLTESAVLGGLLEPLPCLVYEACDLVLHHGNKLMTCLQLAASG